MSETRSEQTLMALLSQKAADFAGESGMSVPGAGRPIARLPKLDDRIEMFARMICGPDVVVTPEIRALARDHILTAMAADLVETTTDFVSEPVIDFASENAAADFAAEPEQTPAAISRVGNGRPRRAREDDARGIWSSVGEWFSPATGSLSVVRLGMVAAPLLVVLVAGSVLTQDWLSQPADENTPASASKSRSIGFGHTDSVAEQNLKNEIAAEEAAHGHSTAVLAGKLVDLASLYRADGHYAQAQSLCERALIIQDQLLGPDSPESLHTIKELATIYLAEGRTKDAANILSRANKP